MKEMKYFTKEEVMKIVRIVESQDYWNTYEMEWLIEIARKEADFDQSQYDDPDRMYEDILNVLEVNEEDIEDVEEKTMKSYKDCEKIRLGFSDVASLIVVGCNEKGVESHVLRFGSDGDYEAYIVDENTEIGNHYKPVISTEYWIKIYDDEKLVFKERSRHTTIYRAGDFGCIIQLEKEEEK